MMCIWQRFLSELLNPAILISIVLVIVTYFYLRATRRMAEAMHKEFALRTRPSVNILLQGLVNLVRFIWIFEWNIENKGFYSVKLLQYQITVFYQKNSAKESFYTSAIGQGVFIAPGGLYCIKDRHNLEAIQQFVKLGDKDIRIIIEAKFNFLDCLGKKFQESRTYQEKISYL